jgi:hypothetical protein
MILVRSGRETSTDTNIATQSLYSKQLGENPCITFFVSWLFL